MMIKDTDNVSSGAEQEAAAVWRGDRDRYQDRSPESWVTDCSAARIATRRYVDKYLSMLCKIHVWEISLITLGFTDAFQCS